MSGWLEALMTAMAVLITMSSVLLAIGGIMMTVKSHSSRIQGLEERERDRIEADHERDENFGKALGEIRQDIATLLERTKKD